MEVEAAKAIGAGLATLGMLGAAVGVGNIFSGLLNLYPWFIVVVPCLPSST